MSRPTWISGEREGGPRLQVLLQSSSSSLSRILPSNYRKNAPPTQSRILGNELGWTGSGGFGRRTFLDSGTTLITVRRGFQVSDTLSLDENGIAPTRAHIAERATNAPPESLTVRK